MDNLIFRIIAITGQIELPSTWKWEVDGISFNSEREAKEWIETSKYLGPQPMFG